MRSLVMGGFAMGCIALANTITERMPSKYFKMPDGITEKDYLPNTVVFKIKEEYRCYFVPGVVHPVGVDTLFRAIGAYGFERMFPHVKPPERDYGHGGVRIPDLTRIYFFRYMGNFSLEYVINKLISTGLFEYVEPYYLPQQLFTPNDPDYPLQWHLPQIRANLAWDINTGNPNVVVAITDTGVDYNHADLSPSILVNSSDPINGVDDDGNGYVDDYYGWDFGDNDNNPAPGLQSHGTHVAGDACAKTNNAIGVASPGFSCKILAVKIDNSAGQLVGGYQGIVYAADRGAHFINASWGSSFYSSVGQDVIDYAYAKGSIVIAGAGNDGTETMFYPAAYDRAVAVASTNSNDQKSSFSNYGYWIDICAPGENIYSTIPGNGYQYMSGTSMASPVMAGSCALVKSQFPGLTSEQVVARVKATAYNLYPNNPLTYKYKLGAGRVDLYDAVSAPQKAWVEMIDKRVKDLNNPSNLFLPGDTISIVGIFKNYLAPTSSITVTLSTYSPYIQIIDGTTTIPSLGTMQVDSNSNDPFIIRVKPMTPMNQEVWITATITDGNFTAYTSFNLFVNIDYINVTINELHTTITSKGLLGYNQFNQVQGLGVKFAGKDLLVEMGIMIGSNSRVVDFIRNGTSNDADFSPVTRVSEITPPPKADFEAEGVFNDNSAPATDILGVTVRHHTYAWNKPGHTRYVIVEYTIKNTGTGPINPLYAGIFADWDVPNDDYAANRCNTNYQRKLNYVYNLNSPLFGGVQVVSPTPFISYCINNDGSGGSVDIYNDYTSAEKYTTLTTTKDTSGTHPTGTDVSAVASTGPFTLNPGDSVTVAFAILADTTLSGLLASADSAYVMYNLVVGEEKSGSRERLKWSVFPNPATSKIYLTGPFYGAEPDIKIMDMMGRVVIHEKIGEKGGHVAIIDVESLAPGTYLIEIRDDKGIWVFPINIVR